jgi:putative SOS response-associated peptidase YedK
MCGRFTLFSEPGDLAALFAVDAIRTDQLPPRYNVAPSQEVYAVAESREGERRLGTLRWGFVPHWADTPRSGPINARAETLHRKSMFRDAFSRRRCLIPADGFYEWREDPRTGAKIPFYIRREDEVPLAFAGLWSVWRPDGGEDDALRTCAIVTTDAQGPLRDIHPRMPLILPPDVWDVWLDPHVDDEEKLRPVLTPWLPDTVESLEVSKRVNNARNEGEELIAPV